MSTVRDFSAEAVKLKDVLFYEEAVYRIPDYQREFSWKKEQWETFWEELVGPNAKKGRFAGSILLLNLIDEGSESVEIVDGQQRATMATIYIAAIRDAAEAAGFANFAKKVQAAEIERFSADDFEAIGFRLIANPSCRNFMEKRIQSFPSVNIESKTKEESRIIGAYNFFRALIDDHMEQLVKEEKQVFLQELRGKVRDLRVIQITVYQDNLKFEIFESVNARGMALGQSDLIKNYILSRVGRAEIEELNADWIDLSNRAENDGKVNLTDVIRYHWNGNYSFVSKNSLFESYKKRIGSVSEVKSYVEELDTFLEGLIDISGAPQTKLKSKLAGDKQQKESFAQACILLNLLQVKLHFGLFTTLYVKSAQLPMGFVSRFAKMVSLFTIAHVGICQLPITRAERLFARLSRDIHKSLLKGENARVKSLNKDFSKAEKDLQDLWPSRELLKDKMSNVSYTNSTKGLIRALLALVEMLDSHHKEILVDWPNVNIEHVEPQNPKDKTRLSQMESKVHLLGNLTLITERLNKKLGNKTPNEKAELFTQSMLLITKNLTSEILDSGWTPDAIDRRTSYLESKLMSILVLS